MLVLDDACLRRAAQAGRLDDLVRLVGDSYFPGHTALAAAWFAAQALDVLAGSDKHVRPCTMYPGLVRLDELTDDEDVALSAWAALLVPRNGPDAGRDGGVACTLAAAEARQAVAVLDDLELVGVAASAGRQVRVLWLPAVLDVFVDKGWDRQEAAASVCRLRQLPGADWRDDDLAAFSWTAS